MKLGTKLVSAFLSVVIIFLILTMVSIISLRKIDDAVESIESGWIPSLLASGQLNINLNKIGMFVTRSIGESSIENININELTINNTLNDVNKIINEYHKILGSSTHDHNEERQLLKSFETTAPQLALIRNKIFEQVKLNEHKTAQDIFNNQYLPLYTILGNAYNKLSDLNVQGVKKATRDANNFGDFATKLSLLLTVVGMIICIAMVWLLTRSILRQLGKDPGELEKISKQVADGDYDIEASKNITGVYASIIDMAHAIKNQIDKAQLESTHAKEESLRAAEATKLAITAQTEAQYKTDIMQRSALQLEEVVKVFSEASRGLAVQIEQSDRGAVEASQHLDEAATAMNEMNATVQEVAKNAAEAAAASNNTKIRAQHGTKIVLQSLASIEEVQKVASTLKNDMALLNEHSQDITRIMGVISDIADQTNLLALNAAIEAARAGEAGRGFAVVADEVRKLAEKTMASTHDVGNAIHSIQQSTAQSVTSMEVAIEQIDNATVFAKQSGIALEEIVTTVEETADQVSAIATASEEQSAASEEINRSLLRTNQMSTQTAEAMHAAAKAVTDLANQSARLQMLVEEMRDSK